jgi:hypothetical protein
VAVARPATTGGHVTERREERCWWLADPSRAAEKVSGYAEALLNGYGRTRRRTMAACLAVYLNEYHSEYAAEGLSYFWKGPSKYPVTSGGVDSVHSKLALNRPRPKILPGSRRFKAKRKAKTLQRWIDGLFKSNESDRLQDDQLHDAMIYRAGIIKVVAEHGKVKHERRHPGDILTDPREERRSNVRSMVEVAAMDREVLAYSDFIDGSKKRDRILDIVAAPEDDETTPPDIGAAIDQVKVIEAWRLPPCPDEPGRHVMVCGDILLLDEPWEWECFPFSILVWGRNPERLMGQGMVQRGLGVQSMLNRHCYTIDNSFGRFVPKYARYIGDTGTDPAVINDAVGQVIEYSVMGSPPTVLSPGPISPDFMGYAAELANRWFAVVGASQMDARAEADASLESGKAKLVQSDINQTRHYMPAKNRERACVRLAELSIMMADLLSDRHKNEHGEDAIDTYATEPGQLAIAESHDESYEHGEREDPLSVPAGRDSWRERIPYAAARMSGKGEESFAIEVWPVSSLSQSVAGRMEEVSQLTAGGYIADPKQARELLNIPVLDDYQDLASARRESIEREIDQCLDGEQGQASSYWLDDLEWAVERAVDELNLAGTDEAPEDILQLLRNFIGTAEMILKKKAADEAAAAAPPAPALPPEPPMMDGPMPMDPMVAA